MSKKIFSIRHIAMIAAVAAGFIFMTTEVAESGAAAGVAVNPLTEKWSGPFGGVPAFDKVRVDDFKAALEAAMEENLREVEAIANQAARPTFENTIVALEKSGQMLNRVSTIYGIWGSNMNTA